MSAAPLYICAAMLLIGVAPLPYGYYTLLRLVACGVFAFAAFAAFQKKNSVLPWVNGVLVLLFNPLIPVHLEKGVWVILDMAAAVYLLATAKMITSRQNVPTS